MPNFKFNIVRKIKKGVENTNMVKDDMTLLIVSHEEEFVNKISDKIIHIQNGKVIIQDNRKKKEIEFLSLKIFAFS